MIIYTGGNIMYDKDDDIKELLKKYECKNIEELDAYLWHTFGVTLHKKQQ